MKSTNIKWSTLLRDLVAKGSPTSPRGFPCRELISWTTTVDMKSPIVTLPARKLGRRFAVAEAWWILSGKNDVASIAPYSKDISAFKNDVGRFDGSYGVKIADQLQFACESLVKDNSTRQAVISIWRENPRDSRDVPCTISYQFLIREFDGKRQLICVTTMRSSDAWLGWVYDVINISMLSTYVLLLIRRMDTRLMDVGLGSLWLTAGSQHLYEKNMPEVSEILVQSDELLDLTAPKYRALDVEEFLGPDDFLKHLELMKDGKSFGRQWLTDLIQTATWEQVMLEQIQLGASVSKHLRKAILGEEETSK